MSEYEELLEKIRSEVRLKKYEGIISNIFSFVEVNKLQDTFIKMFYSHIDKNKDLFDTLLLIYQDLLEKTKK